MQTPIEYMIGRWRFRRMRRKHERLKKTGIRPDKPGSDEPMVFVISIHRTGTRSLDRYLEDLGYTGLHWPWWCEPELEKVRDDTDAILSVLEPVFYEYNCFSDVPFPALYKEMDRMFPNAKFILMKRDSEKWWDSCFRLFKLGQQERYRLLPCEYIQYQAYPTSRKTEVTAMDKQDLITAYETHNREVPEYFAGRPEKLLVVELLDPDLNRKVSEFLGKPVKPFPLVGRKQRTSAS